VRNDEPSEEEVSELPTEMLKEVSYSGEPVLQTEEIPSEDFQAAAFLDDQVLDSDILEQVDEEEDFDDNN
jgi:hypothetical protein